MSAPALASGEHYRDTTFRGIRQQQGVVGTVFMGCSFEECELRELDLTRCRVLACSFVACDLSLLRVDDTAFRDASFDACNLTGVDFGRARATLHDPLEVDFRDCVLDFASFRGCDLTGRRLDHCRCHEADLRDATLRGAVCRGSDFAGAAFGGADLGGADLRRARNYAIDVRHTRVRGARVSLPDAAALLLGLEVELEPESARAPGAAVPGDGGR